MEEEILTRKYHHNCKVYKGFRKTAFKSWNEAPLSQSRLGFITYFLAYGNQENNQDITRGKTKGGGYQRKFDQYEKELPDEEEVTQEETLTKAYG